VSLASARLRAFPIALGCMGMSEFYVDSDRASAADTIQVAIDSGITMFDTSDMYGPFTNEELVGRCLAPHRGRVTIATKFGYVRAPDGTRLGFNGHPDYVRQACEASLRRLRTDVIDLYYLHRVDPKVPIEETVGAMARLVEAGKVRHLGVSEAGPQTVRRAHATAPIAALQTEYSLLAREPERDLFPLLDELGILFVGYAPLARGFLTGRYPTPESFPEGDYRRTSPRFCGENFRHNTNLLAGLSAVAARHGVSEAQVAVAWACRRLAKGVVLIGTTRPLHLMAAVAACRLKLSEQEGIGLDNAFPIGVARGDRYPDMTRVNR
jgi:aryl-alcohol dehydrogenase-like predicted oxidoreductase